VAGRCGRARATGALAGALRALARAQTLDGRAAIAASAARARMRLKLN